MTVDRRHFLSACSALGLSSTLLPGALYSLVHSGADITTETIAQAEEIAGIELAEEDRALLVEELSEQIDSFAALRELNMPNSVAPALVFRTHQPDHLPTNTKGVDIWKPEHVDLPADDESLAYMNVSELAYLLKTRRIKSVQITKLYLDRLKKYDGVLEAVVTYTEDRALNEAAAADAELDAGNWRGPLHGIPYGAKDLLAVKGYPTTWGAVPYKNQVLDYDAEVVTKLHRAGAVLIAKLTLGALAWGDVWYGGKTKNPWNIEQGSSGSSAGPGSAVAAGLVGFAIGSETLGSIVSPSTRNGVTGHRPTFGTVSRHGAMALSWTMDKLGPMARSALDCALIYTAIHGHDARDSSTVASSFEFDVSLDVTSLRVGYLPDAFDGDYTNRQADQEVLTTLRSMGVDLIPISLPNDLPVEAMLMTLGVEAAAAFDDLTRSGQVDEMVRQGKNTWPHEFRKSRFVPAVEYVQANRARSLLMERMQRVMDDVDVFVSPSFRGGTLRITNLTGHPCVCLPNAFHELDDTSVPERRQPGSITMVGGLFKDAEVLALASAYQAKTDFHRRRPPVH